MPPDSSSLDELEASLNTLRPRACGCVHELESAVKGSVVFCPVPVRQVNSACFHKPYDDVLINLVSFSHRLGLITRDEHETLSRQLRDADLSLEMIDLDAQVRSEDLVNIEGVPSGPLVSNPMVRLTKERQHTHVQTHKDVIALLKERLRKHRDEI